MPRQKGKCDTCNTETNRVTSTRCQPCYHKQRIKRVLSCKYCSKVIKNMYTDQCWDCYTEKSKGENSQNWKGGYKRNFCRDCSEPCSNKSIRCKKCSNKKLGKNRIGIKLPHLAGINNPNYNHSLSDEERDRFRFSKHIEWAKKIKERDNFSCNICSKSGYLHSHHLYSFSKYPEKRYDIDNGVTLCKSCHNEFHKEFGKSDNTPKQFEEFKKSK